MAVQNNSDVDVDRPASLQDQHYDASLPSSASTSQASVFSDNASEQSSVATTSEDDFRLSTEQDTYCSSQAAVAINHQAFTEKQPAANPTWADITSVPLAQRQHPRRSSLARNQKPPPLVRQADRKLNFVDNLVGE